MAVEFVPFGKAIIPAGGTAGQVLVKNSSTPFDVAWGAAATGGGTVTPGAEYVTDDELAAALEAELAGYVTIQQFDTALATKQPAGDYVTGTALSQSETFSRDLGNSTGSLAMTSVTGLGSALGEKAPAIHTHTIGNVTGLQDALNAKTSVGHTHTVADITDVTDFATGLLTANDQADALGALGAMADDAVLPVSQVNGLADALASRPIVVEVASLAAYNALPVKTPGVLYIYPEA